MLSTPRLHPNGFIQVDISPDQRINIWDDNLPPAQTINTPIHDHTFSFSSRIVVGTLIHVAYDFSAHGSGDYQLWGVEPWNDGEETKLHPLTGMRGDLSIFETLTLPVGDQYQFKAGLFHETQHKGFTVTIMTKTVKHVTAAARVAVPRDGSVDNDFNRDQYAGLLLTPFVNEAMKYLDPDTLTQVLRD